ncbi:MAG: phosphotransferase, partial [Candidatus Eremiobacteraeota bacterium]|nr:phosphotransferase [Candidatus Eremiobacteraeota bacterium]
MAAAVLGETILSVRPTGRGGNNRLYRIETPERVVALKLYDPQFDDGLERLERERGALSFLGALGSGAVPKLLATDRQAQVLAMEWIDGVVPLPPSESDIVQALDLARELHAARDSAAARDLGPAREACVSVAELQAQLGSRLER